MYVRIKNERKYLREIKLYKENALCSKVTKMFPDFKSTLCSNQESSLRSCDRFYYLVEYKLSKSQLRNIEDFVDKGEKSGFYSIGLPSGSCNKVQEITSASSLCGTCNGNYFRPVTQVLSFNLEQI